MANHAVEFSDRARQDLEALSTGTAARMVRRLQELTENPYPRGDTVKRLQGFPVPTFRFRIADYRAIYRIFGAKVVVLRVMHRSQLDRALRILR